MMKERIKYFTIFILIAIYLLVTAGGIFYVVNMCYGKLKMLVSNFDNKISTILLITMILASMLLLFIVFIILLLTAIACIIEGVTGKNNPYINTKEKDTEIDDDEYIDEESKEIENLIKKGRDSIFGNDRMS